MRDWVERILKDNNLAPGSYAAVHLRALYGRIQYEQRDQATLREWTRNGMNCTSRLHRGGPFFFSSDHPGAVDEALQYGKERSTKVVARIHDKRPNHLEKAPGIGQLKASDFYDTFVDLLLIGMSRCVGYNRGGFGTWGLLIGYDPHCEQNQKTSAKGIGVLCSWTELNEERKVPSTLSGAPFFLDPMGTGEQEKSNSEAAGEQNKVTIERNSSLPEWMSNYISWHRQTKSQLDEGNWNETKYLTMSCSRQDHSCGGISDRLKVSTDMLVSFLSLLLFSELDKRCNAIPLH